MSEEKRVERAYVGEDEGQGGGAALEDAACGGSEGASW